MNPIEAMLAADVQRRGVRHVGRTLLAFAVLTGGTALAGLLLGSLRPWQQIEAALLIMAAVNALSLLWLIRYRPVPGRAPSPGWRDRMNFTLMLFVPGVGPGVALLRLYRPADFGRAGGECLREG